MTSPTPNRRNSSMYEALPQRLATLRRNKAISQEELANTLGVSRQAVSKWERGESSPDTLNLIGLADLYNMSLDELVRGANAAPSDPESNPAPSQELAEESSPASQAPDLIITPEDSTEQPSSATEVQNSTTKVTECASDGVVKVEVVTTTIPLEAASTFMPKTETNAPDKTKPQGHYPAPDPRHLEIPVAINTPKAQTPDPHPTASSPQSIHPHDFKPPKKPKKTEGALMMFPYPAACALLFILMGFGFDAWHPGWIIFLTIPIYYWIAEIIEKDPLYQLRIQERKERIRRQYEAYQYQMESSEDPSQNQTPWNH